MFVLNINFTFRGCIISFIMAVFAEISFDNSVSFENTKRGQFWSDAEQHINTEVFSLPAEEIILVDFTPQELTTLVLLGSFANEVSSHLLKFFSLL